MPAPPHSCRRGCGPARQNFAKRRMRVVDQRLASDASASQQLEVGSYVVIWEPGGGAADSGSGEHRPLACWFWRLAKTNLWAWDWKGGVACAPGAPDRSFAASRRKERAGRPRSPEFWCIVVAFFAASLVICRAQDAISPPATDEIFVSATRIPVPEKETPASVSVITARDLEEKQIEPISDALREFPACPSCRAARRGSSLRFLPAD